MALIKLKKSSTAAAAPTSAVMDYGELAINYADGILYYKDSSNVIKQIGSNATVAGAVLLTGTQTITGAKTFNSTLTLAPAASLTASQPAIDVTQTWDNGAVTFTGLKQNITNNSSAVGSLLMDLQVGGSSKFRVDSAGSLKLNGTQNTFGTAIIDFSNSGGFATTSQVSGISGETTNSGAGSIIGINVNAATSFAGTVASLTSVMGNVRTLNASTVVTNSRMFYALSPIVTAGAITNQYGLYIESQKPAGVTAGYGVYQLGATDINYFAGNVGIGTVSPAYPLHVVGAAGNIIRYDRTSVGSFNVVLSGQVTGSAVDFLMTASQASSGFLWRVSDASNASINALSIDRNGNVGISTIAPAYKLDVTGTGRFTSTLLVSGATTLSSTLAVTGATSIQGSALHDLPTYSAEFLSATTWVSTGWTGSFSAGWTHTTGNVTALSYTTTAAVTSTKYQIAWTVTGRTAGSFSIGFGGEILAGISATDAWGPTALSTASLAITPTTDFNGTIVISIKSITGISTSLVNLKSSDGIVRIEIRANAATSSANNNTFIGFEAGRYNTTGVNNIAYGYNAFAFNTTGFANTAIGRASLYSNTTGNYNTANGGNALYYNTTGNYNTANGCESGFANTTGIANTANGYASLYSNTTGYYNTANGYASLNVNATGVGNTAIGYSSLLSATNSANTAIGYNAGRTITTGDSNTFLGNFAGFDASQVNSVSNSMALGNGAYTTASNQVVIGNTSVTQTLLNGNVGIGTAAPNKLLTLVQANTGTSIGSGKLLRVLSANAVNAHSAIGFGWNSHATNADPVIIGYKITSTTGYGQGNFYIANRNGTTDVEPTEVFTILPDGNVGIGTTTPTGKIDIQGSAIHDLPTYSAEFLSTNTWTSTVTADWTGSFAAGWTHTTGNTSVLSYTTAAVITTKYQIAYTVTGRTAGSFTIAFGGDSLATSGTGAWGPTTSSTAPLTITPTTDFNGTIVISIKSIISASTALVILKSSDGTARIEIRANNPTAGNTFIGLGAGRYTTTGYQNTANGYQSLINNTTGYQNTADGYSSLYYNTTGYLNLANGAYSLYSNTTGYQNTADGYSSLYYNTTGFGNNAVGYASLYSNTTGYYNTAIGTSALQANTTGINNVACGHASLNVNTTGVGNTAIGYASLLSATNSSSNNTVVGQNAGRTLTTSNYNTFLGNSAGYHGSQSLTASNSMALGNGTYTTADNQVVIGNTSVTQTQLNGSVGIGTTAPLLKLDVAGSGRFTGASTSTITGSIDAIASTTVTGVGTLFLTELVVGDRITITGETRTVTAIASNTSLTVDAATTDTANDTSVDKLAAIFVTRLSSNAIGMVQNDLGNLGIGTAAPTSPLTIIASSTTAIASLTNTATNPITFSGLSIIGTNSNTDTAYGQNKAGGSILLRNTDSSANVYSSISGQNSSFGTSAGIMFIHENSSTNQGAMSFFTRPSGSPFAEVGRFSSTGNFGIGTASPTNILSLGNAAARKFWIENSATDVVGRALTVAAGGTVTGTSTSNVVGGNLILQSGLGTGTGASAIEFQTGTTLTTGLTLQTMSTKMTILGSGNVGIGTTSPAHNLQILGVGTEASPTTLSINAPDYQTAGDSRIILSQNTSPGDFQLLYAGTDSRGDGRTANNAYIEQNQQISIRTKTNGSVYNSEILVGGGGVMFGTNVTNSAATERVRIDTSGNVGIGTTSPAYPLHVVGAAGNIIRYDRTSVGSFNAILSGQVTGSVVDFLMSANQASSGFLWRVSNASNVSINALSIDPNGNVGIGTTAPTSMLKILGSPSAPSITSGAAAIFELGSSAGTSLVFTNDSSSPFATSIQNRNSSSSSNAAYPIALNPLGGNVGIGTTSPTYTLDVTGTGRFTSTLLVSGATTIASSLTVTGTPANLGRYTTFSAGGVQTNSFNDNSAAVFPFVARNTQPAANYGTGYGFALGYGGGQLIDGTSVAAGDIVVAQETAYTSTLSTQDSYMRFSTSLDGVVAEKMRITSTGNVSIAGALTTTVGGAAGTGTQTMTTQAYLGSRGMNLVVNGTAFLGNNYNFSGFTLDQTDTFTGKGSFRALHGTAAGTVLSNESISVDPDKTHLLTVYAKTTQFTSISTLYVGIDSLDIDGTQVLPQHTMRRTGTDTRLLVPLATNDMVVVVTTAPSSWYQAAWVSGNGYLRAIILWGYKNSFGFTYPDYTYSKYWITDMYLSSNSVSQLVLTNFGSGYTDGTYSLTFTPVNGGTGATGSYVVLGGGVVSVYITADGSGYIAAPTVSFPSGGGINAAATAKITSNATTSTVEYLVKGVSGAGYTGTTQPLTFTGGGATTQATGHVTINSGGVDRVVLLTTGSGYTSNPTVTVGGTPTTVATVYATIGTGIDQTNNRIYLRNPFPAASGYLTSGTTWPIGSALSNGSSGGTFKYIAVAGSTIPTSWTKYTGKIGGIDLNGQEVQNMFRPGTAAVRILFLPNYNAISNCVISTTVSAAGSGYTAIPTLTFGTTPTAGSLTATGSAVMRVVSVTGFAAAGSGYAVGNIITVTTGTGTAATFQVTAVNSGAVTTLVALNTGGAYTVLPTLSAVATTANPAGGTGLTLNLSMGIGSVTILTTGSGYSSSTSKVLSATISSGGTGYTANDILTVTGGTSTTVATFTVNTVSSGVVTAVTFLAAGVYTFSPHNPAATTGGTGSGCTLIVTWEGPVLTAYSLSGTGATFQVTRGNNAQNYSDISFTEVVDRNVATFQPLLTTEVGLNVKLLSGQTASIQEWQNSSGTALASIGTSGQFLAGNVNSAASPSIAFTGDTGTGMYRSAASTLHLVTGGVARVTIDSAGALSAGVSTFYASGASSSSSPTGTNWLRSPKNTVTAFIGDSDSTSAYTASEFSGNLRFNGGGVNWGDFGYYPTGGVSGTTNFGHFRFSLAGSTVATTPNAWVSAGVFIAATGFRVSNSAQTAANYLRSNGTDFVSAALAATDLTGTIAAARLPAFTGDVTSTVGTVALAISGSYTASLRAGYTLSGGGTITYDSSSYLLWSTRIIVISNGYGSHFSTSGYFDIDCPTSGTITGVGGATNTTATSAGILIGNWYALYYILPIGSSSASVAANFRIVGFSSALVIPEYWVLLAVQNNDGVYIKLFNAQSLKTGQSYNTTLGTTSATNLIAGTVATARLGSGTANATSVLHGDQTWHAPVGIVPVGTVLSWLKSFTNTPALATEFVECNGQTLSDAGSVYNTQTIPNLNASGGGTQRFLRGFTASGGTGGSETHTHTVTSASTSISVAGTGTTLVTSVTSPTGSTSTLPSYYEVVWIIRIK